MTRTYEEEAVKHRRLRRANDRFQAANFDSLDYYDTFGEAPERRRLMSCGVSRHLCPHNEPARCNCECKRAYMRCYTSKTGSQCSNIRRTPVRVCNGQRCIWDWKGYKPPGGTHMVRNIEGCKNAEVACKRKCSSVKATNYPPRYNFFRI